MFCENTFVYLMNVRMRPQFGRPTVIVQRRCASLAAGRGLEEISSYYFANPDSILFHN